MQGTKAGKMGAIVGTVALVALGLVAYPRTAQASEPNPPATASHGQGNLTTVEKYLRHAYNFRYKEDTPGPIVQRVSGSTAGTYTGFYTSQGYDYWQLPNETQKLGTGDCEDKAIWLYVRLLQHGYTNVRLVVGKYEASSSVYHVWVNWYVKTVGKDGRVKETVYILDPTVDYRPWPASSFSAGYYLPLYSFYKDQRWVHPLNPS